VSETGAMDQWGSSTGRVGGNDSAPLNTRGNTKAHPAVCGSNPHLNELPRHFIMLTDHEKAEWRRCALAMAHAGKHEVVDMFSRFTASLSLPPTVQEFDHAAGIYRAWLVFNEIPESA
jgi:hypothetical protein